MKKNLIVFILVTFVTGVFFSCSGGKETNAFNILLNQTENEIKDAEKVSKNLQKLMADPEKNKTEISTLKNDLNKKAVKIGELLADYQMGRIFDKPTSSQERRYDKLMERAERL
jgi:peptidoglycan hydrolase CwlO-like protein